MGGTDYGYKYYSSCKAGSGILFGIYGTKKTSFVELPTPTESVNTYNSQTAILDNETVATIHFPSGISVELKQSVPDSLIRTLVEASTYVK